MLQNLEAGKFERLSFLTGTLRGILDKPAAVSRAIRAGSIFMLPLYVGCMVFVGICTDDGAQQRYGAGEWTVLILTLSLLGVFASAQLLAAPVSYHR